MSPKSAAARDFLGQAGETINSAVTDADVRETLVQHILTGGIFDRVFGQSDIPREKSRGWHDQRLRHFFFESRAVKVQPRPIRSLNRSTAD